MSRSAVKVIEFPREVYPRRQGRSVLRISAHPLPIAEAIAKSGETLPASEGKMHEVMAAADSFRSHLDAELKAEIKAEARLYDAGFYANRDTDGSEKRRRIGLLTLATHLERSLGRAQERVRERGDAGTCSAFEVALNRVMELVGEDYFELSNDSLAQGYSRAAPAFETCMNVCGLPELAMPLGQVFRAYSRELAESVRREYCAL